MYKMSLFSNLSDNSKPAAACPLNLERISS
uniref:Uncharacterized protein n=1 Tax=Anguilla anguilla TaxID=7936 RepID=A0A0E9PMP1_ANGAN